MAVIEPVEPITTYGLAEGSTVKEKIVKKDENTAIRYRVVEERIDLEALRQEKEELEVALATKEPSNEELIEGGKMSHPYYAQDKTRIQERIDAISVILEAG